MDAFSHAWTDVVTGSIALWFLNLQAEASNSRVFAAVFNIECAVAFFIFIFISYTLKTVFPLLAIVEDEATPDYEAVQLKDDSDLEESAEYMTSPGDEDGAIPQSRPITSSLRSTYRLLRETRGLGGLWRGLEYAVPHGILIGLIVLIMVASCSRLIGSIIGSTLISYTIASLLTVQFGVAWTHSLISEPGRNSYWHRLPPYSLAFRATALPTIVAGLAFSITEVVPHIITELIISRKHNGIGWLLIMGLRGLFYIFVAIPTTVVLVRVRASLLPEADRTIVAFDRALTLHRASGKEYMTMTDAWKSFSRAAWIRLVKLYAKIWAVSFLIYLAMCSIFAGEMFLVWFSNSH
ncbi:hypothetical protein Hte_003952 [Hypoxylon texense]